MLGILMLSCVQQLETCCAAENLSFHPRNQAGLSWGAGGGCSICSARRLHVLSQKASSAGKIGGQGDEKAVRLCG